MADVLVVSCRLCLQADELTSMVTVDRLCGSPPQTVSFSICRPCARAIDAKLQELNTEGAAAPTAAPKTPTLQSPGESEVSNEQPKQEAQPDVGEAPAVDESDSPPPRKLRGRVH